MSPTRRIVVTETNGITVVRFLDLKIVTSIAMEHLGEQLDDLVTTEKRVNLILNFEGVEFVSSEFLSKFITLNKMTSAAGGKLRLCNLNAVLKEIIEISKLDRLLDIRKTLADAIDAYEM